MSPGRQAATVLCVGQATLDHLFTVEVPLRPGHKHVGTRHVTVGGGVAANAAVTVARLGGRSSLAGRIGDDHDADLVLAGLESEHVDTRLLRRRAGVATPTSAVIVGPGGERTIVNHTAEDLFGDPAPVSGEPVPVFGDLRPDVVLVDGRWPAGSTAGLRLARDLGACGVVDVDRAPSGGELTAMLGLASHVVFGEDALATVTGTSDPAEGLRRVGSGAVAAVTCGARGVWWRSRDRVHRQDDVHDDVRDGVHDDVRWIPAVPIDAVDTTAAGDVFHGAFALALAERMSTGAALRFAAAAAAIKCTRVGGRAGIPARHEVEELLANAPAEQVGGR